MFAEVSGDKTPVLMRKLKLCSVVFDFSEGSGLESEKEVQIVSVYPPPASFPLTHPQIKRLHLLDLIEYINALKTPFPESILPEVSPGRLPLLILRHQTRCAGHRHGQREHVPPSPLPPR